MDIETSIRTMKNESVKKGMGSSMKLPPDVKRTVNNVTVSK